MGENVGGSVIGVGEGVAEGIVGEGEATGDGTDPGFVADGGMFADEDGVGETIEDIGEADFGIAVEGAAGDAGPIFEGRGDAPRFILAGIGEVVAAGEEGDALTVAIFDFGETAMVRGARIEEDRDGSLDCGLIDGRPAGLIPADLEAERLLFEEGEDEGSPAPARSAIEGVGVGLA